MGRLKMRTLTYLLMSMRVFFFRMSAGFLSALYELVIYENIVRIRLNL